MSDQGRHPVDLLAEEFATRMRSGEKPTIEEYLARYPTLAKEIHAVLTPIALVERVSQQQEKQHLSDSQTAANPISLTPSVLGDFEIVSEIGRGGMGIVYKAIQRSLKRLVALKVVSGIAATSNKQRTRFRREAEAAAGLHHTNIVPVFGIGEDQGWQYYTMQLIDGVSLGDVIGHMRYGLPASRHDPLGHAIARPSSGKVGSTVSNSQTQSGTAPALSTTPNSTTPNSTTPNAATPNAATPNAATPNAATPNTGAPNAVAANSEKAYAENSTPQLKISPRGTDSGSLHIHSSFETSQAVGMLVGRTSSYPLRDHSSTDPANPSALPAGLTANDFQNAPTQLQTAVPFKKACEKDFSVEEPARAEVVVANLGAAYFRNVARLVANIANALDYAHHQGVYHRDIKPSNLMLDRDGTVWITDFGLARHADLASVTQTGEIVGTLRYMAPEQMSGAFDHRSDLYALGLTFFELLTLRPAWTTPEKFLTQSRPDSVPRPRSIRPEIPADLETIILKACEASPAARYQTGAELEEDLKRFLDDRPILARPISSAERLWRWAKRNQAIAGLASVTVLLLITLASLLAYGYIQKQRDYLAIQTAYSGVQKEFIRAEQHLSEKTAALKQVTLEQQRAETNLDLAMAAFNQIADNIATRGTANSSISAIDDDLEDEAADLANAALSSADLAIMETLLAFFDKFSVENSKDLSTESAEARRRVGDIQQHLGKLMPAIRSYQQSLVAYQEIAKRKPDDSSLILAQVSILSDMMLVACKQSRIPQNGLRPNDQFDAARRQLENVMTWYDRARRLIEENQTLPQTAEGKLALANLLNRFASLGAIIRRNPQAAAPGPIFVPSNNNPRNQLTTEFIEKLSRTEVKSNQEALALLKELSEYDASSIAYRTAMVQNYRDLIRIARVEGDMQKSERALESAVALLQGLLADRPASDRLKYDLASTLSGSVPPRLAAPRVTTMPVEMQRLNRAEKLCEELLKSRPGNPDYLLLRASILFKRGTRLNRQDRFEQAKVALAEAARIQHELMDHFPEKRAYVTSLVETHVLIAQIEETQKHPRDAKEQYRSAIQAIEIYRRANPFPGFMQPRVIQLQEKINSI